MSTVLAIETSCDETACAIVRDGHDILANVVASQVKIHEKFGGVVPEVASRKHLEYIDLVVAEALEEAGLDLEALDGIGVTYGPGLVGALLVGVSTAKALAYAAGKPLIGVHHIEGHIYANFLAHPEICLPAICLIASGGHTNIVEISAPGVYHSLGKTRDDAAGEAFDKVGRALGLPYPGGPKIDALALEHETSLHFPRAVLDHPYDFSFSGLKSAVLNHLNQCQMRGEPAAVPEVARAFQDAVIDVLVDHTMAACEAQGIRTVLLAGGVSANQGLRNAFHEVCRERGYDLFYPPLALCTDNAAMIAAAACAKLDRGETAGLELNAVARLPFSDYIAG